MSGASTVVVVGASVGGVRTAQALRSSGFDGRVVVVGREPHLPYDKPPLSKQLLAGTVEVDRIGLITADAAAEARIELRLGVAAERLDVPGRRLVLADGDELGWDHVVLATGADARPSPWDAPGVHVLRTLDDSRALASALAGPGPVVVVGGGFIGAEVAATARAAGHDVTVVDPVPTPIGRVLGERVGAVFTGLHHRHGTATRFGVGVDSVEGAAPDLRVVLADGDVLRAGVVVVGIGAVPNDRWLAGSGLRVDDGVVCDEVGRALAQDGSLAPGVHAVGDVARWTTATGPRRVEHWTGAVEQATTVARTIADPDAPAAHRGTGYVWSDQYDQVVQVVGRTGGEPSAVVGDLDAGPVRAAAVWSDEDGALRGLVAISWPKALVTGRKLLAGGGSAADAVAALEALPAPAARS